jgi:predicted nucleic acid-binding Zn ribbon protein
VSRRRPEKEPAPLRGLLGPAASGYGLDDALAAGTLSKRWVEVVGPDVAAHAEPTSLREGVLRVRADSPVWAHEIGYLAAEIKRRANETLGRQAVSEVKVWNAPGTPVGGQGAGAARSASRSPERSPEELEQDPQTALEKARSAWAARRRRSGP